MLLRADQMTELDARRTEVRNKAAIAVQSRFHAHVAREQFLALRMTSSKIRCKFFFEMWQKAFTGFLLDE
jgi:myosin-5